jgi:hypothetical protein
MDMVFILKEYIWIRVITKLPNSEQSYKGKVKTHPEKTTDLSQITEKLVLAIKKLQGLVEVWPYNMSQLKNSQPIDIFKRKIYDGFNESWNSPVCIYQNVPLYNGFHIEGIYMNKGNNKITELRAILQRESQNS